MTESQSIFGRYYAQEPFVDRYAANSDGAVDIVIPVLHSNELWRNNLISIYREIPVNRLRLGDGGCKDQTLTIAREFPRVEIYDHSAFKSLGYSVKELIKAVETEWFCYFHSDVYVPDGWFETMRAHQSEYDWFGCPMRITALLEFPLVDEARPYAGTQMGRKAAFVDGLERIDDDYVYRQEDFVFARLVEDGGFRHGKIEDTFHWHQVMQRAYGDSRRARKFKQVTFEVESAPEEELFTMQTQLHGTIKYLEPTPYHVNSAEHNVRHLERLGKIGPEFYDWVARTNPEWLSFLQVPPTAAPPVAIADSTAQPPAPQEGPAPDGTEKPGHSALAPQRGAHPLRALAKALLPLPARAAARRVERIVRGTTAERCRDIAKLCEALAVRLSH